ncbi:MAG: cyclic nucleotide-binding domain-containing protein [Rhodoferax sp.]|nr:cyclic nucleotide-binding domain-containing protein [Rhodoferax sp.]
MSTKIDPAVIQMFAENVRAQVLPKPGTIKLDASIVQKIAQRVPVFAGMSPDCLMTTLATAENYPVKAGEAVFKEGDIGSAFYVVIAGEVIVQKYKDGETVELARLGTGQCFGEMALVQNDVRTATVVAIGDSTTMRFERERIEAIPESAHIIYRNIARILASRLDESSVMLAELMVQQKSQSGPMPLDGNIDI